MRDGKARNKLNPADSRVVEETDTFIFDLVLALDLFYDELRVRKHLKLLTSRKDSESKGRQKCGVFSEVVCAYPKVFGNAHYTWEIHANPGLPRIPPRAAVDVRFKLHATSNG